MSISFRPLEDRILLKRLASDTKTKGGILLPERFQSKKPEAVVVAVGPGHIGRDGKRRPPDLKPGDLVMLAQWAGAEITLDGEDHLVVREPELLCVQRAGAKQ